VGGGAGMCSPAPLAPWRYNSKVEVGRDKPEQQRVKNRGPTSGKEGSVREGRDLELGPPSS
jgi:hypothetical protein